MVKLTDMKPFARIVKDENGQPVVQVPLDIWEAVVGKITEQRLAQRRQMLDLLKQWKNDPENDMSEEWWDDFLQFLKENRVKLGDPDSFHISEQSPTVH